MLQREGLIRMEPNRRIEVAPFSISDLEQLYAMRIINESLALRLSTPRATSQDFENLDRLLGDMDDFAQERDLTGWEKPHRAFHRTLVRHAGARILRLVGELADHSERYRRYYMDRGPLAWSIAPEEHHSIFSAVTSGMAEKASELMAAHLARTALTVLLLIAPDYEPSVVRCALRATASEESLRLVALKT
jgi:DNA-binding GntR family transcriptional regulator